jgi:hypothetical protein
MSDLEHQANQLGLLTRKERDWLQGKIIISKSYEYRLRSGIRKKLRAFTEFELPLLSKSGLLDVLSKHPFYYHPGEQQEPRMGFGAGNYYDNTSLGKAKYFLLSTKIKPLGFSQFTA